MPGANGALYAVTGDMPFDLVRWRNTADESGEFGESEHLTSRTAGFPSGFGLDVGGDLLAYRVDEGSAGDLPRIEVMGPGGSLSNVAWGVNSMAWHESTPRRLAAVRQMPDGRVDLITITFGDSLAHPTVESTIGLGVSHRWWRGPTMGSLSSRGKRCGTPTSSLCWTNPAR